MGSESFRSPWDILHSSLHRLFSPSCYYDLDFDPELRHRFTLRQGRRREARVPVPAVRGQGKAMNGKRETQVNVYLRACPWRNVDWNYVAYVYGMICI